MFRHLDDPNPPRPTGALADRVHAEGRRRRRRRARRLGGALVVALVVGGAAAARPWADDDRRGVIAGEGTSTTTAPVTSTQPDAEVWPTSGVFAAITDGGEVVLADVETGDRVLTLGAIEPGGAADVARAPDGTAVYVATGEEELWRYTPGAPPTRLGTAATVAVSPDGTRLAVLSRDSQLYGTIRILDAVSGQVAQTLTMTALAGSSDLAAWLVEWDWSGGGLMVEAALPEAGSEVFLVDLERAEATRLGPPDGLPGGTGWTLGGRAGVDTAWIVETCCSRDANSFDGGRTLLRVDLESGDVVDRVPLDVPYALVDPGPTGSGVESLGFLLVSSCCGDPTAEVRRGSADGQVASVGWSGFVAVDW